MAESIHAVLLASFIGVSGVAYTAHLSYEATEHQVQAQITQIRAANAQNLANELRSKATEYLLALDSASAYVMRADKFDLAVQKKLDSELRNAAIALQPYASPELAAEALSASELYPKRHDMELRGSQDIADLSLDITRSQVRFSELLVIELLVLNESAIPGYKKSRDEHDIELTRVLKVIDDEITRLKEEKTNPTPSTTDPTAS